VAMALGAVWVFHQTGLTANLGSNVVVGQTCRGEMEVHAGLIGLTLGVRGAMTGYRARSMVGSALATCQGVTVRHIFATATFRALQGH